MLRPIAGNWPYLLTLTPEFGVSETTKKRNVYFFPDAEKNICTQWKKHRLPSVTLQFSASESPKILTGSKMCSH